MCLDMKIRRFSSSTCRCNVFLSKQQWRDLRAPKGNYVSYVGLRFFFCKYRILYQLPEQPILRDDFTNHRLVRFLLGFVKQSRDNFVVMLPVKRVDPYLENGTACGVRRDTGCLAETKRNTKYAYVINMVLPIN